ncbi:hypothetical protein AVEN_12718-1 [Araneus ventricosus]|uniref:Uncharacterized protein n=1 Tax=Araneus ventricosus TaxID=182803 RepID=A0A4Y2AB04_ARAVE|nr:hypothetical protein AVEN_12718-1 [Araneus ventricosus]
MIPASRKCKRMVDCGRKLFRSPSLIIPVAREREREKKIGRREKERGSSRLCRMSQGISPSGCGDRFSRSAGVPFSHLFSHPSPTLLLMLGKLYPLASQPACLRYLEALPLPSAYRHEPSDPLKSISSFSIDLPRLHYLEEKKEDGHVGSRRQGPITSGLLGNVYGVELTFADRPAGVVRPKEKMKTIVELDGSPRIHMPTHPPNHAGVAIKARLWEPLL